MLWNISKSFLNMKFMPVSVSGVSSSFSSQSLFFFLSYIDKFDLTKFLWLQI